ncbi:sensor histidine kinase [Taibaiella koreensis]|uniref:sensor histidine kinase n=1 Tax=Taibaiella koreensis TaxID=1268548 RepID=UPI000E59F5F8|nr:HAMP domain-containing sensor histidine kinase [Taibaiella koreensis]
MKLFSRYHRYHLILMALLFICSGVLYYVLVRQIVIHELDEALDDCKKRIIVYTEAHEQFPAESPIGETYVRYTPAAATQADQYALTNLPVPGKRKLHRYRQLTFTVDREGRHFQVLVARPLEGTKLMIQAILATTLGLLLLVILISVLLNRLLLANTWKPFYQTLDRLSGFQLGKNAPLELPDTTIDEFRFLHRSLQQMVGLAEQEYRILKEFTENAAHEMQTPLAIVRSKLDLVIQQEGLSEQQAQAIHSAYAGIKRLDKLNRSLLLLARIENRQYGEQSLIDLESKTAEKLEQMQELARGAGVTIHSNLEAAMIRFNETLLDILLNNLLGNAIRHNLPGGSVTVRLGPGALRIANTGQEQPLDTTHVFRRFRKEQQHSSGHGLGLSIAHQICLQSSTGLHYTHEGAQHIFTLTW